MVLVCMGGVMVFLDMFVTGIHNIRIKGRASFRFWIGGLRWRHWFWCNDCMYDNIASFPFDLLGNAYFDRL